MNDLITICIPTYRRPSFLLHCLHSCLLQDYRPLEIDVSDNSPTDETRLLVESLAPPPGIAIRYWRNCPAVEPVENHKKLLASARGRRFVWMNDDDVLLPGAVSAMSDGFSLAPDVIASYGLEQIINQNGEVLPEQSARWNNEYGRLREYTGLRHDLLVCAFWQQISHVGFMILTGAARKVGFRNRSEVGLASDVDFAIRLALEYKGSAFAFIDRMTVQSRVGSSTLSQTSLDVAWRFYDLVSSMTDLSPEEERARTRLLRRIGPVTLREMSLAHQRRAAFRILFSHPYPRDGGAVMLAYSLGLIVTPNLTFAIRRMASERLGKNGWFYRRIATVLGSGRPPSA